MGLFDSFINRIKSKSEAKKDLAERIKNEEVQLTSFEKDYSGKYIFRYNYKNHEDAFRSIQLEAIKLHVSANSYQNTYSEFIAMIEKHNSVYLDGKIEEGYNLIRDVEGQRLDRQQMACIVKDTENHLVVAGAGTGKTTTILGKVKYLLKTSDIKPEEFLIVSFTNAAAGEMKMRLQKETNEKFYVATFHKLGYDIIRRAEGITPKVFEGSLNAFALDYISNCTDVSYQRKLLDYILYSNVKDKSEFSFDSIEDYKEYLAVNPPTTINDEVVKSYGEMLIANFLAQHGIRYVYEAPYLADTRTEEYKQYQPDFYLPDYNIYIEYFGIDREGNVPEYFSGKDGKSASETYNEGIAWKRNIHKDNGTTLIECYAYEHFEGVLLDNLKDKLSNIELKQLLIDEILGQTNKKNLFSTLANTMATVITLSKNKRLDSNDLYALNFDKKIVDLIAPVFSSYQEYLKSNNLIDFTDMLNHATDLVVENSFQHVFKYVIIDEYQDISSSQYQMLKALRNQSDYSLFAVGDDWQSIYRFAGSDIGYIINFDDYWGDSEISRIETTYRFSQRLSDISSDFIMQNPNQIRKRLQSGKNTDTYVIGQINGYTEKNAMHFMAERVRNLPQNSTVFFLGRYQFDIDLLKDDFTLEYDNRNGVNKVKLSGRSDLKMSFYTVHKSKGLQADYVFIINNRNTYMGFPSKVQNPDIIERLLERMDDYPDSEERRLFYVALTRARRKVFIVSADNKQSSFACEMISKYGAEMKKEVWTCPICGGSLRKVKGPYGEFYGCSNYPKCKYTSNKRKY